MIKERKKLNTAFDVTYNISFSGRTKGDGEMTVTSQMVRDKILGVLELMILQGFITEYTMSAEFNNIQQAKHILKKNKEKKE